ncbi:MAG: hypothetical protein U0521_06825 [Anaerolineae bacterium]
MKATTTASIRSAAVIANVRSNTSNTLARSAALLRASSSVPVSACARMASSTCAPSAPGFRNTASVEMNGSSKYHDRRCGS